MKLTNLYPLFLSFFIINNINGMYSIPSSHCIKDVYSLNKSRLDIHLDALKQKSKIAFHLKETILNFKNPIKNLSRTIVDSLPEKVVYIKLDSFIVNNPWAVMKLSSFNENVIYFNNNYYTKIIIENNQNNNEISIQLSEYKRYKILRKNLIGPFFTKNLNPAEIDQKSLIEYRVLEEDTISDNDIFNTMNFSIMYQNKKWIIAAIENVRYYEESNELIFGHIQTHPLFRMNGLQDLLLTRFLSKFPHAKIISSTLSDVNKLVFITSLLNILNKNNIIHLQETEIKNLSYMPIEDLKKLAYYHLVPLTKVLLQEYSLQALKQTPLYKSRIKINFPKIYSLKLRYSKTNLDIHVVFFKQ